MLTWQGISWTRLQRWTWHHGTTVSWMSVHDGFIGQCGRQIITKCAAWDNLVFTVDKRHPFSSCYKRSLLILQQSLVHAATGNVVPNPWLRIHQSLSALHSQYAQNSVFDRTSRNTMFWEMRLLSQDSSCLCGRRRTWYETLHLKTWRSTAC